MHDYDNSLYTLLLLNILFELLAGQSRPPLGMWSTPGVVDPFIGLPLII